MNSVYHGMLVHLKFSISIVHVVVLFYQSLIVVGFTFAYFPIY